MAVTWVDNTNISHDQWLLNRLSSIGASETGVIVYGNKWSSSLELFYNKIGHSTKNRVENIRMFLGTETESTSLKLWEYYDGTEQSVVDNFRTGNKVKHAINKKATAFNDLYPHLSVTPDGIIQPFGKYAGRGEGSLEIKNTMQFVLDSYTTGLPPDNVMQLCTQMMVAELDYADLFYFIDNCRFQCHEVERKDTKNIEEIIIEKTTIFWQKVLAARPLYNQLFEANRNHNMRLVNELQVEIALLEPEPQNTDGWRNFLTERYKDKLAEVGVIKGSDIQLEIAKKHKELGRSIDTLEAEQRKLEIELKHIIGDNNTLDFGKNGKVTWIENKNGKRGFSNKVK